MAMAVILAPTLSVDARITAMAKKALITGVTGQDGSYLSELLLENGYEVHGIVRRVALEDPEHRLGRIRHLLGKITLHPASMESYPSLYKVMTSVQPDEIYHLAAQSHVRVSFDIPEYTGEVTGLGAVRMLEAIRESGVQTRFYNASSSEMFGSAAPPQSETTPFQPQSSSWRGGAECR